MKVIIIILLFPLLVNAQSSSIKSWDIVKTFMGMDSANAQKIVKGSGYKYQRTIENIGLKLSEFSRGFIPIESDFSIMIPDDIFLGSRNGIVEFIKLEVTDLSFNDYSNALKKDGFALEPNSRVDKTQEGVATWISNKQGIKVVGYRQRDTEYPNNNYRLDALFIVKTTEKYCFPPPDFCRQSGGDCNIFRQIVNPIAYRSTAVDNDGIESYKYEPLLYQLACIDPDTKKEDAANAIQMFWYLNYSRMIGDIPGFDLGNRNILFYAVKADFGSLLKAFFVDYKIDPDLLYYHYKKPVKLIEYAYEELESRKSEIPSNKYSIQAVQSSIEIINGKYKK